MLNLASRRVWAALIWGGALVIWAPESAPDVLGWVVRVAAVIALFTLAIRHGSESWLREGWRTAQMDGYRRSLARAIVAVAGLGGATAALVLGTEATNSALASNGARAAAIGAAGLAGAGVAFVAMMLGPRFARSFAAAEPRIGCSPDAASP